MDTGIVNTLRPSIDAMSTARAAGASTRRNAHDLGDRKKVGEFVGNIFYGTLIRQMQASTLKSPVMGGGRGEEVFGGQMALELSKRMGEAPNNPLTDRIYRSILKHHSLGAASKGGASK